MTSRVFSLAGLVSTAVAVTFVDENSVEPPFFIGDGFSIPNWDFFGNSVVSDEAVRLTPDRQNKRGALWNLKACSLKSWQLDVEFKVTGQGKSLFGDGFALWYTEEVGKLGGALGNTETFTGLGIFADTYDNHAEDHGHPWIAPLYNDGTKEYDHDDDGKEHTSDGCQSFFRNLDYPTYLRIVYRQEHQTLTLATSIKGNGEYEDCFTQRDIYLPVGYHFGASASTGDLADNHDIISMKVSPAPASTAEEIDSFKEYKKTAPVGSMEMAKKLAIADMKKKISDTKEKREKTSNHRKREKDNRRGRGEEDGSSPFSMILTIFVLLAVAVGVVYAYLNKSKVGAAMSSQADHKRFSF